MCVSLLARLRISAHQSRAFAQNGDWVLFRLGAGLQQFFLGDFKRCLWQSVIGASDYYGY